MIFVYNICDKGLLFKIYKELTVLYKKMARESENVFCQRRQTRSPTKIFTITHHQENTDKKQ